MSSYRRITRFLTVAAAGASILLGLTACHLPFTSADAEGAVTTAAHNPAIRHLPEQISELPGVLEDLKEATDSPVGAAVIGTACDSFAKGDTNPDWEYDILSNLLADTQPPEQQLLDTVQNLAATFSQDVRNGLTTPEEIGMACEAYLAKNDLG